jgi:hypothetical protein
MTTEQNDAEVALLRELVARFVAGTLTWREFSVTFETLYTEVYDADGWTDADYEDLATVHERLELTAEAPGPEDRRYGWHDVESTREWLRDRSA